MKKTESEILQEYYQKFDDSEIKELQEKIEELASQRASFFQDLANDDSLGGELQEKMEDYWRSFDNIACGEADEIFEPFREVREGVSGILRECDSCDKMGVLKPKLLQSVLGTGKMYISNLCEYCYSSDHLCVQRKREIDGDTEIPKGLTKEEVLIITDFIKKMGSKNNE